MDLDAATLDDVKKFVADNYNATNVVVGHCSAEPGHARVLEAIGKPVLLDLGMRLGEGSGAVAALPLVRSAALLLRDVALLSDLDL